MQNEKIIENATAIGPLKQHNINMIFLSVYIFNIWHTFLLLFYLKKEVLHKNKTWKISMIWVPKNKSGYANPIIRRFCSTKRESVK